ncbi:P-loop containing nucleoside triphosphate hydrolase protein [Bombardia bombarda]|uniref:P-loop containing nucleoside triphosphate hydrolase protein n=1 Tax=Bombardia bombarda TaxID=252184 RepID=A0AA40CF17_9PEZI|nr:P-loop containing nucleoside triphosphate hydrolase protein [Bombardia bombarda]
MFIFTHYSRLSLIKLSTPYILFCISTRDIINIKMGDQVTRLVDKAWDKFLQTPKEKRLLITIGGIPGSGKTTLSQTITNALNARHEAAATDETTALAQIIGPIAAFVPMDGYHLTRAQLSAMPDPVRAHARRGAEFTFDGAGFLQLVRALREPLTAESKPVFAPSFDHAVKDPKADDIAVLPTQRIVVFEGNYVLLDKEPWRTAAALMDEKWFVDVDVALARRRLATRHVAAGIVGDLEEGDRRAMENDLPNGEEVVALRLDVDEVVVSQEDGRLLAL